MFTFLLFLLTFTFLLIFNSFFYHNFFSLLLHFHSYLLSLTSLFLPPTFHFFSHSLPCIFFPSKITLHSLYFFFFLFIIQYLNSLNLIKKLNLTLQHILLSPLHSSISTFKFSTVILCFFPKRLLISFSFFFISSWSSFLNSWILSFNNFLVSNYLSTNKTCII